MVMLLPLTVLIGTTLPAVFGASFSLRGGRPRALRFSTGGDFNLGVNIFFTLNTGNNLTVEEQKFAKNCIRRSYNAVHDRNSAVMKFVDIVDEEKAPIPTAIYQDSASLERRHQPFNWALGVTLMGNCRLCSSGAGLATSTTNRTAAMVRLDRRRGTWERQLCGKLRHGPFEAFHNVSNCTIAIYLPETGINNDVQDVKLGISSNFNLPVDRVLSTNEQLFANDCLRVAYNDVHDPTTAFMDTTDLQNQTYQTNGVGRSPDGSKHMNVFMWTLEWITQASFRHVDAYDDDSNNPAFPTVTSSSVDEQHHNRWEVAFCEQVRVGPFEAFRGINNCQILVNNVTPLFAADRNFELKK